MATAARSLSPLPPVERLRPGLWSIPVPIPNNSLRYVFVYAFETDRGPYIVDAGWNTDDAFASLSDGLTQAGFAIGDVQGVMVTHIHPDHYGLAGRVREASGAWIALHSADAALIHDRYEEPTDLLERGGAMLRRFGGPPPCGRGGGRCCGGAALPRRRSRSCSRRRSGCGVMSTSPAPTGCSRTV